MLDYVLALTWIAGDGAHESTHLAPTRERCEERALNERVYLMRHSGAQFVVYSCIPLAAARRIGLWRP